MPNRNYQRGRDSEYKAQRELEALGYQTARTAGSHGAADVIAWNRCHVRYIQIKTFKKQKGNYKDDLEKIDALLLPPHSQAELWVRQIRKQGWLKQEVLRTWDSETKTTSPSTTDGE
jgi:Holliday junction resolvase